MKIRIPIALSLFATFLNLAAATESKKDAKPNVILIITDDLGNTGLSGWGSSFYETPHIDALNHINNPAKQDGSVLMLGRYKHVLPDKQIKQIRAAFDNLRIDFKTVHSSKGLEYDFVIILGLNSGKYGFPCQIVDDPVMSLVLPVEEDFEHSEERRLFYVACTRAKHSVYLINGIPTNGNFKGALPPSTFLNEAIANTKYVEPLNTECVIKPLCPECGIGVMVKRDGPHGEFLACSFRFCDHTKNIPPSGSKEK